MGQKKGFKVDLARFLPQLEDVMYCVAGKSIRRVNVKEIENDAGVRGTGFLKYEIVFKSSGTLIRDFRFSKDGQ